MANITVENTAPEVKDNSAQVETTETTSTTTTPETTTTTQATAWGWKEKLSQDLKGSPLLSKFEDTPEGLGKAFSSHANLEQLLGHEKVPIPKDSNDVEGWARYSKAMGVPDKADGYGLPDAKLPESMVKQGLTLNKQQFAEVMHQNKVHPSAVKGIWDVYQKLNIDAYNTALTKHKENLTKTVNALKSEWGESYGVNVELGQTVINKFSADQETNDYITTVLSHDPRGIKFLAKIGDQFAENKIPEFSTKRFAANPDEALEDAKKMQRDLDGPYMNQAGKYTEKEHQAAVEKVNHLYGVYQKSRRQG